MRIDIITLFPSMFRGVFDESIISRGVKAGVLSIHFHDLREWGIGAHKVVDGRAYGGGVGMVLRADVLGRCISDVEKMDSEPLYKILMTPQGRVFKQSVAKELSTRKRIALICGRYEGFDERVRDLVDDEISIGDFVLTGGEIPAMVIADTVCRLVPGVLTKKEAVEFESFTDESLLEYPQYTRPEEINGQKVPEVLLSGNHAEIENWRREQSVTRTHLRRRDLLSKKQ